MTPAINTKDSEQNAFVQSWLEAWAREHGDLPQVEAVIEIVQETYAPPRPEDVEYERLVAKGWSRRDAARHARAYADQLEAESMFGSDFGITTEEEL